MNQRRVRRCLLAIAIAMQAHTVSAWDGQTTGKIAGSHRFGVKS